MFRAAIIGLIFLTGTSVHSKEWKFADVKKTSTIAIKQGYFSVVKPRLDIDDTSVAFLPPQISGDWGRPADYVVAIQSKLELAKNSYGDTFPQSVFKPVIDLAEAQVNGQIMQVLNSPDLEDSVKVEQISVIVGEIEEAFDSAARRYAQTADKNYRLVRARKNCAVECQTSPLPGKIYQMHVLTYINLQIEGIDPRDLMALVPNGAKVNWEGTHVVRVVFNNGAQYGPDNISIGKSGVLTLCEDGTHSFKEEQ